ncbi:hypothetical protein Pint_09154 [Pistacia integerrima]|uniref:Uncharacterized protein n=1 Tax=Pistacia integerrima TaxID=434235 RepID=A0ACC0XXF5_9ROSI|nr:hypothetical protein Pint_09154 [Pistacia integerrima]
MASLAAIVSVPSTGTRTSLLASRSCFCSKKIIIVSGQQKKAERRNVSVKATGMPKFKGTHMREKKLAEMIEQKVVEAKQVCEGDLTSDECKVAWDEVEEDNPETDECRIYDD